MPFIMPSAAAAITSVSGPSKATSTPPAAPSSDSTIRQRRRPSRSPHHVTMNNATTAPIKPALMVRPMAVAENPARARCNPSNTPAMPVANARRKAAMLMRWRSFMALLRFVLFLFPACASLLE
jgi:hypothetical protein